MKIKTFSQSNESGRRITLGIASNLNKDPHFMEFVKTMSGHKMGEIFDMYAKKYPEKAEFLYNKEVGPLPKTQSLETETDIHRFTSNEFDLTPSPKGFKYETEGKVLVDSKEDGGMALICDSFKFKSDDDESGMFVTLQSWDDRMVHRDLLRLIGKNVRITIQVLD
jgi:hypothetical protein